MSGRKSGRGKTAAVEHGVPLGEEGGLIGEEIVGGVEDVDAGDFVAAADGVDDILTGGDFTEDRVFAVEPVGRDVSDEELGAVGARAGIGHGEDAGFGVFEGRVEFVTELVAWAAGAGAGGVAALDHEVGDDAVEFDAVVVAALGEVEEVGAGHGRLRGEERAFDLAFVGVNDDADVSHEMGDWRIGGW